MIPENLKKYDYRSHLLVDPNNPILVYKAWRDRFSKKSHWREGYGGKAYLSKLNSEDALTWNVFRTLQKDGELGLKVVSKAFNIEKIQKILFWGCDVEETGEEQQLLNILIRTIDGQHEGTMTEPDLIIITEQEVVFIECKLNQNGKTSPWKAQGKGASKRWQTYMLKENFPELVTLEDWRDVYQMVRQYIYAKMLGKYLNKKPVIIPLINGEHKDILINYYQKIQQNPLKRYAKFSDFVTWQDLLEKITQSESSKKVEIVQKIQEALYNSSTKKQKKQHGSF